MEKSFFKNKTIKELNMINTKNKSGMKGPVIKAIGIKQNRIVENFIR